MHNFWGTQGAPEVFFPNVTKLYFKVQCQSGTPTFGGYPEWNKERSGEN